MSLSKRITLTIKDYSMTLSGNLNFYVNDCLDLVFEINKWGIDNKKATVNDSKFDLTGITAYLFVENSNLVDSIEATKIEDNEITFKFTNKYTILVGKGRMQIKLVDEDGCELKLPPFNYNIESTINEFADMNPDNESVLVSEDGAVLLTEDRKLLMIPSEFNNPNLVKMSDLPVVDSLKYTDDLLVNNNGVTKRVPVSDVKISTEQVEYISKIPAITSQLEQMENSQKNILQENINKLNLKIYNDIKYNYNINKNSQWYTEDLNTYWYSPTVTVTSDYKIINGIKFTKITSSNFYHELRTKRTGLGKPLDTEKYYIVSGFCFSEIPTFFYHKDRNTSSCVSAVYCDKELRRFWYLTKGMNDILWFFKGYPSYGNNDSVYIGGLNIEEIETPSKLNGIIVIGDSTVQASSGNNDNMNDANWTKFLRGLLNCDVYNRGIGGNTTQQMIDRWKTDITPLKDKAKYCIIQGGINDLSRSDVTVDSIVNNHETMHQLAINDGLIPIHLTITPCNKTGKAENIRMQVNNKIKEKYSDCYIDIHTNITDITDTSKLKPQSGYYGDGVHYGQIARIQVANDICNGYNWEFIKPSPYQYKKDESAIPQRFKQVLNADNGEKRVEYKEFGTGFDLEFYEGTELSLKIREYCGVTTVESLRGDLIVKSNKDVKVQTPNGNLNIENQLQIPLIAPTTNLGHGQLFLENGKLYITVNTVKKEIQFVS